jgi:hypothetical protein
MNQRKKKKLKNIKKVPDPTETASATSLESHVFSAWWVQDHQPGWRCL